MKHAKTLIAKPGRGKKTLLVAGVLCTLAAPPASAQSSGTVIRQMLASIKAHRWEQAEAVVALTHDRFTIRLYNWLYYTQGGGPVEFDRLAAFIRANPDWPKQNRMKLAAERVMPGSLPAAEVVAWYEDEPPQTPQGEDRYLRAVYDLGENQKATTLLRAWWRTTSLTPDQQAAFMHVYGGSLDRDSDLVRLETDLARGDYPSAQALANALGHDYVALAAARAALLQGRSDAMGWVGAVPRELRDDPPLLLDEIRYAVKRDDMYHALEIMHNAPPGGQVADQDGWWQARAALVRKLLETKQYESAYLLAKDHGLTEGQDFADAEFMTGWLALRFMHRPAEAFQHFNALYRAASTPVSQARGAYWAGQASVAGGSAEVAKQWYQLAARHQTTFYGQLAIGELKEKDRPEQQGPPARTMEGADSFERSDLARAAIALNESGFYDQSGNFLDAAAAAAKTPEQYRLAAELAEKIGHPQNAIRIAKKGLARNILLMDQLFPTMLEHMRHVTIEWALAHALIRQESSFDLRAQSPVGALGLMQLMPGTASDVARKNGLPYRPDLLVSDPDYNIQIGSLYFQQLLDRYDNSYPLALAAYNAGPGRVNTWLDEFGDPRHDKIALADWIELIPITETRNYVQRVLEGVYVYRIKLQGVQRSYHPD